MTTRNDFPRLHLYPPTLRCTIAITAYYSKPPHSKLRSEPTVGQTRFAAIVATTENPARTANSQPTSTLQVSTLDPRNLSFLLGPLRYNASFPALPPSSPLTILPVPTTIASPLASLCSASTNMLLGP